MRDRLQAIVQHVATGEHRQHADCCTGGRGVDPTDQRMRVGGSHHHRVGLTSHVDVVAVTPAPGEQA
jgi:hypothetical protein